ncbi:MAG: glycosyltransferase family 4 protein [Chloroflexia bacterium]
MRVLHVIQGYYPWVGGSQRFFQEISERLVTAGHSVTVVTTDAGELEHFWSRGRRTVQPAEETIRGVQVLRFPVRRRLNGTFLFSVYRRLMAELSDLPWDTTPLLRRIGRLTPRVPGLEEYLSHTDTAFDLVNGANITLDFMLTPALSFARARRIPFVVTPFTHLGAPGQRRVQRYYTMRHQREILLQADAVITQTALESELLARLGVAQEKLYCIGAGIEPASVQGGDGRRFRDRYGLEGPIVFYIGTLARDKGTVQLVEAMRRLWASGREAHLVLAGLPLSSLRGWLERVAAAERGRLLWLGFIDEDEKRDLLAAGDIFCMPSCTDSFGIVYLEAWANGVPVIGARAGGVPAVIADGVDGLLVDFGDVAGLTHAIERLLDEPALRREMGLRGREKVLQGMTWSHVFDRIRVLYERLVEGRDGASARRSKLPNDAPSVDNGRHLS